MYRVLISMSLVSCCVPWVETRAVEIELYPQYFTLKLGEQIHYTAVGRVVDAKPRFLEQIVPFTFETSDPHKLSMDHKDGRFTGKTVGSTEVVVRTNDGTVARFPIRVTNETFRPISRTECKDVPRIRSAWTVMVVHANRDGFDHTRVAKLGIDRVVREAKAKGNTVVFLMSPEYPNWDTTDQEPTHGIDSHSGGHNLRLGSKEIVFVGGNFHWCLLECVKSSVISFVSESRV